MFPTVSFALILTWCLAKGGCISYDELKDLKIEFAINLYRHASEAENRTNLVISPASVAVSLELLQFGAQGNTFMELQNALGYNIHESLPNAPALMQNTQEKHFTPQTAEIRKTLLIPQSHRQWCLAEGQHCSTPRGSLTYRKNNLKEASYRELKKSKGCYWVDVDQSVQDMLHKVYEGTADSGQGAVVQLACSLFMHTGVQLSPHFAARISHWANSSLQQTDFTDPKQTEAQIQGWITGNLADMDVHGVPSEEAVSLLSRVAVVSTMYFKSTWLKKFSFMDTQILPFTTAESSTLKVPTMHHTAEVNYGQFQTTTQDAFSVVELPYLGEKLSMFIVLPSHKRTPLSQIESHLSAKTIALWSSSLKRTKMDVFLPRFSIQSLFDLKTVFSALGIRDAFDPITANFKGISEQAGLYISEAIHKAKIEVTEDGTKASGATAMVLLKRSRTPVFKADRPFTFFLRQANTGSVLFIGRVTNPL